MPDNLDLKYAIRGALEDFNRKPLAEAAIALLETLGYRSEKRFGLSPNTAEQFRADFDPQKKLNGDRALVGWWSSVDVLFQITDEEIREGMGGQQALFASNRVDRTVINSYLFFAIGLKEREKPYTRTELATITREVNKLFLMPVMLLFRHGETVSIAIIRRRLHKRDEGRDVLEKVTLIKDIRLQNPLRAHIEILADFHLAQLDKDFRAQDFSQLHAAWERRLGTYTLNERFYRDVANWYFAALQDRRIIYPRSAQSDEQHSIFLIRLLTRLIFCWFLQEKDLIPAEIFSERKAASLLKDFSPESGTYYRGILQNLFFATLNQPQQERDFRHKYKHPGTRDGNRGATQFYRYAGLLHDASQLIDLFQSVPFLNGGLFECLDEVFKKAENRSDLRFDDFSEESGNLSHLPNDIFFEDKGHEVDLSKVYDDPRKRRATTRGLIDILDSYKFTIEENTPLEEEIALDPELLGKVFENLLASYNEETRTTARKATGSFYTPREIVAYMVDETLLLYLQETVPDVSMAGLRALFTADPQDYDSPFSADQTTDLIAALDNVRVLDPACGSGAFPMGMLQRMVNLLAKLDPNNTHWKQQQLEKAQRDLERAESMEDEEIRKAAVEEARARIDDIQHSFDTRHHELDFARKLYLIENCIYGVDIQPVAIQIAKLRFFITLVVDQITDHRAPNQGVRPLPNLETKLVAADSLFPLPRPKEAMMSLGDYAVRDLRENLRLVRHEYFRARTPEKKAACRADDARLRQQIAGQLRQNGWAADSAKKLADWDPYNPNQAADFLEPEWMFGGLTRPVKPSPATLRGAFSFVNQARGQMEMTPPPEDASDEWRFDIVIGNPPYVRQEQIKHLKPRLKPLYECYTGTADLFVYFYERGVRLLRPGGAFAFISSNKYFRSGYGEKLRRFLSTHTAIHQLVDFGDADVFKAISYPSIVIAQKSPNTNIQVRTLVWKMGDPLEEFKIILERSSVAVAQIDLSPNGWQLETDTVLRLLDKLRQTGETLGEYLDGKLFRGIITGLNAALVVPRASYDQLIAEHSSSAEVLKPFLRGRDVKRWKVNFAGQYLIRIESSENRKHPWTGKSEVEAERIFAETYPAIHAHLQDFRDALIQRDDQGKYFWELRSCVYWGEFDKHKIIYPDIYEHQSFAFSTEGYFSGNTTYFIPTDEVWLCGLFNSILIEWFYSRLSNKLQSGYLRAFTDYMKQIPVPPTTQKQRETISQVVACALALAQVGKSEHARLASFESLLNGLVYELFFPAELDAAGLHLFDLAAKVPLPDLKSIPEGERLPSLQAAHEAIFMGDHPIRSALFSLRGLEPVRTIEAEEPVKPSSDYENPED